MTKKNKTEQIPTWQQRGFISKEHFYGFLHFNGLVHSSDGNEYVSVNDENETSVLFKEEQE